MKRYIYIIIGIIIAAIIAIGILFLLKGNSALTGILPPSITGALPFVGTQGNTNSSLGSTTTGSGSLGTGGVSSSTGQNGAAQSVAITATGPFINYFIDTQGDVLGIQPSGQVVELSGSQSSTISSSQINNIISTGFSYDGKMLLVNFGDPSNPQTAVLTIASGAWTALPQGLQSPQWSSSNYQIAFLDAYGAGATALDLVDVTNPKKINPTTLFSLNATDLSLQWISKTQFVLSDKPSAQTSGSSWIYNSQSRTLNSVIYEASGPETIWGGSTTTVGLAFFNSASGQGPQLQLVDINGNDLHDLNFLTLPTKCVFNNVAAIAATTTAATTTASASTAKAATSTTFLYCGVPSDSSQLASAQLPDDYNDGVVFTSDEIIKLNAGTGDLTTLWSSTSQPIDATDLKVFDNTLYFLNRYDQKLYSLPLAQ